MDPINVGCVVTLSYITSWTVQSLLSVRAEHLLHLLRLSYWSIFQTLSAQADGPRPHYMLDRAKQTGIIRCTRRTKEISSSRISLRTLYLYLHAYKRTPSKRHANCQSMPNASDHANHILIQCQVNREARTSGAHREDKISGDHHGRI